MSGENTDPVFLSEEIIIDILKRLPVKSLLRFISVCRSWCSLIKSPHFVSTHLSHQIAVAKNSSMDGKRYLFYYEHGNCRQIYPIYCDNDNFDTQLELTFPEKAVGHRVGFCDGIVCLCSDLAQPNIVLWNPSLQKIISLSIPHTTGLNETFAHGFGFDSSSNDYKIVSIAYSVSMSEEPTCVAVWVYSLNLGTWKRVNADFVLGLECAIQYRGVPLNGVIHWLVQRRNHVPASILTFDLADEKFCIISRPVDYDPGQYAYGTLMKVLGSDTEECLAYLNVDRKIMGPNAYTLWVMGTYGVRDSWREVLSLNREAAYRNVVNVKKNGDVIVELNDGRLALLDPRDMSLTVVSDENRSLGYLGTYLESLLLL